MALNRKYANLPDLDSAPDTYETPSLTDDNSTAPTGRPRSDSDASSYKDFEEQEEDTPGIFRSRLHPDEARSLFSPSQTNTKDINFSDRVYAKRKSFKASSRRQRIQQDGTEEYGDFSEDEGETLEARLARLRREIEEVKEEFGKRQVADSQAEDTEDVEQDVRSLSQMLDGISNAQNTTTNSSGKFVKELGTGVRANGPPQTSQRSTEPSTYTVTYAPTYEQSHALAKASDFDVRLSLLERSLGLNPKDLPASSSRAVIPTLETLRHQIKLLTESTPSSLDNISRRVRTLTQEAEKYEETRKSAKAAQDALRAAGGEVDGEDGEDSEQTAKINALYGTLSTIENLAPVLPLLLDRLRSLRAIHADAATASDGLEKVEFKQAEMAEDIKKWKEGLHKIEEVMKNGQNVMAGNMKTVEGWVKDLEQKLQNI